MRRFIVAIVLLFAVTTWGQVPGKRRVAVLDFDNAAAQSGVNVSFLQANAPDVGKAVSGLLVAKLVQDGQVIVIERDAIDKILAEQNLSNSDRADPATAARLGRLLGVDALVLGTITRYEYDEKMKGAGASTLRMLTPLGGGQPSYKGKYEARAKVQISTRLISPDTAEVLVVCEGNGEAARKNVKTDLRDTGGRIARGAGLNSPVMSEAVDKAVAQLTPQLQPVFAKLPQHAPIIDGLIADVSDSGRLVLNVGAQTGLKVGDHLQVFRAGKEIRDPINGKLLMRDDILLGEAVVTSVSDASAVAQYHGAEPAQVRDLVKSMSGQH